MKDMIYLDYNATAPMPDAVLKALQESQSCALNASAVHSYGREGRKRIEAARRNVADLVNLPPAQIIFNSGATESNNTVLKHFTGQRVLVSAIEHPSVLEVLPDAEIIPVRQNGQVDLAALEDMLKQTPRASLVSVMMVNNETGIIQPVTEISALAHKHGALFHCDAVQAGGRIDIDMPAMGIDFLSLSAHKIGGPQGVGALALGLCGVTPVMFEGGGQEKKARAGTENVAGIYGFGEAARLAVMGMADYQKRIGLMRQNLELELVKRSPEICVYGQDVPRVANTILLSVPGVASETLLMGFDLEGVALSNGSACASGSVQPSHVLKAMGQSDDQARSALRISMGYATQSSDIDRFLAIWDNIQARLKK